MHFYRGGQESYKQYEVIGKSSVKTEYSQIASIVTLSVPRITKSQKPNPWPTLEEMEIFIYNLSTHGCLTSLRNTPQQKLPG